jgi:hypothetical protein
MTNLTTTTPRSVCTRRAGALGIVGALGMGAGLLGAIHAVLLVAYPARAAEGSYGFPVRPSGFIVSQGILTVRDLALVVLLAGLFCTPVARGWVARVGLVGGAVSMLALAALEVVSVAVGGSVDVGASYGLASFGVGIGLTTAGISAARTPMRSPGLRFLPLTIGLYVFAVLTPGILAGFTAGQLVIGGWMSLFAGLGRALSATSLGSPQGSHPTLGTA